MSASQTNADTFPFPKHGFTCFHCGETFHTEKTARAHFGVTPDAITECLRERIAGRDRVREELANWHRHKPALTIVLRAFTRDNPKWQSEGRQQDPCGAHALLEWIENETWYGFEYPSTTADALAVEQENTPCSR